MRRTLLILTPVIVVLGLAAALLSYFHPQIESFITSQIRSLSSRFTPVEVTVEHIAFHAFPPSIELQAVKMAAKDPVALGFDLIEIDAALADLDFLQLLGGRIGISTLTLEAPDIDLNLDAYFGKSSSPARGIDLNPVFDQLKIIPIHRISLTELSAEINSKKLNLHLTIDESSALIVNAGDSIIMESEFESESFSYHSIKDGAHLRMGAVVRRDEIEVPQFHLSTLGSDVLVKGTVFNLEDFKNSLTARVQITTASDLEKLWSLIGPEFKIPQLKGKAKITTQLDFERGHLKIGTLETETQAVNIDGIEVGNVFINGEWKDDKFKTSTFQITNEATQVDLRQLEVDVKWVDGQPQAVLKTHLSTEMLDLNQLLENLTVSEIPIELIASGEFQCGGPLIPEPSITCQGSAHTELFEARTKYNKGSVIVQIGELTTTGTVNIDSKRVQFQAGLQIGENKADVDGHVSFTQGFQINYTTPEFDFKNVDYLVNLNFAGKAALSGQVSGDKSHAVFNINADGREMWFENFFLGNPKMNVHYQKGLLSFDDITSNINSSRFTAKVEVDLHEDQITVRGQSQNLDASDALYAFQKKVNLPVEITGTGDVKVNAWGPLDFSHLSYDFETNIQKGTIAGETFDEVNFRVHSDHGEVRVNELRLKKGQGQIFGQGNAHPDGTAEVSLETLGMLLEESENVARLSPNISGQWSSALKLTGRILDPEVLLEASVKNLIVEDQDLPPSRTHLKFNSHGISGNADLFDGKLKTSFIFPMTDKDPFKLEASARDWNYTTIFTLIGGAPLLTEYQASLTGDLRLHSDKGGFFSSSGEGTILKAELRRKNFFLSNPGPMEMKMDKGKLSLNNFRVAGDDSYAEISTSGTTQNALNLKARANLQLHLLQIFLPFIDELSGTANIQTTINGNIDKPEILGTGNLQNGLIKLKALPHAFEKVSAKAQFSQTKIIVSDLKGNFAGGTATGDGTINIAGIRNIPMLFKARFENVTVNIPDRVKTSGYGDIVFSGNWFPFTLAGTYHATGGLVTKEFTDELSNQTSKQSSYLPKILLQNAFEPIELNLQVVLDEPLQVNNSLFDGSLNGGILILGTPTSPNLKGKVGMEHGAKLNFKDKIFDVSSGSVTFENPKEINPELFITAQSHVNEYDINLTVQGNAKSPIIRLDSLPSLPYQDIVSLLALGITSGTTDDNGGTQRRDSGTATTQAVAQAIGQISKDAQKAYGFTVQVTSDYDDTKNMAIQKYTLTGKLFDKVTYSASQTTGDLASQKAEVKYRLNPNMSLSGSYENIESAQSSTSTQVEPTWHGFGIDLEFRQEFK